MGKPAYPGASIPGTAMHILLCIDFSLLKGVAKFKFVVVVVVVVVVVIVVEIV